MGIAAVEMFCAIEHCVRRVYNDAGDTVGHRESLGCRPEGSQPLVQVSHKQNWVPGSLPAIGDPGELMCLLALETSLGGNHTGACYTMIHRVNRGFGSYFLCARSTCGHQANMHVEDGEDTLCNENGCVCPGWVEPPGTTDTPNSPGMAMGPDAPVVTNENGASQSAIPAVFTTMPLRALWELSKLQKQGDEKYGPHNWRGISVDDHINHAFAHLMAHSLGDTTDQHLLHAAWRLVAALEQRLDDGGGRE